MKKKVLKRTLGCAVLIACGMLAFAGCGKNADAPAAENATKIEASKEGTEAGKKEETQKTENKKEETQKVTPSASDSNYWYEQLSDEEKAFFDQIRSQAESFLMGNEEPGIKQYSDGVAYYFGNFDQGNLSDERANQIAELFYYSCPRYFFTSWYLLREDGKCSLMIWSDYPTRAIIASYRDQIEARSKEWIDSVAGITDDLEKEKAILKLIGDNTEIGTVPRLDSAGNPMVDENGAEVSNWNNQFIVGVFADGKAICTGYARAMQYLCNSVGLECLYILAPDSANYAWNMVKLNGDWYCVDTMWLDGVELKATNGNLNKSYEFFRNYGGGDTHAVHPKFESYGMKIPECTRNTVKGEPELVTGDVGDFTIENGVLKSYNGSDVNIVIPAEVMEIDAVVFNVDHEVESFEVQDGNTCFCAIDGVLFSKDKETLVCYPKARQGAYTVPDGTKKIADRAFFLQPRGDFTDTARWNQIHWGRSPAFLSEHDRA